MNWTRFGSKFFLGLLAMLALALAAAPSPSAGGDNNAPAPTSKLEETNSQETLRTYLQLQEQLHATQLAIEENRKEAREAGAQTAEALTRQLQAIEQAIAAQRARELETMQSSNRLMLIVAGTFAAIGFAAMLIMAYFQWRTVNGLATLSTALSPTHPLGPAPAIAALGPGGDLPDKAGPAAQSHQRLLGALEQLEKRLSDLEHASSSPKAGAPADPGFAPGNGNGGGKPAPGSPGGASRADRPAPSSEADRVSVLLAKGQVLLTLDNTEAALACFDEALALAPNHAEALVKKGTALERLQQIEAALECYDRAIAADGSMTIAYLHKGGLFSRLERFNEAIECYEKALQTQQAANSVAEGPSPQENRNPKAEA